MRRAAATDKVALTWSAADAFRDRPHRVYTSGPAGWARLLAAMDASTILTALSELAPAGHRRVLDVTGGRMPLWLTDPDRPPRTRTVEKLAATDALHQDERVLRRGWVFVIGTQLVDGVRRRVCVPLLSEPVRIRRGMRGYSVIPAGDLAITHLVDDPDLAAELELGGGNTENWLYGNPAINDWIYATTRAAGLHIDRILHRTAPRRHLFDDVPHAEDWSRDDSRLVALIRAGVYVAGETLGSSLRETLRSWAARPGLHETAMAAVYGVEGGTHRPDHQPPGTGHGGRHSGRHGGRHGGGNPPDGAVLSPLPLDEAQAEVVRRARSDRVCVVSGPPGSGKSHAVVAAALDVVDRGGSVLLATQSSHAADVLGEMLKRYPGPTPVLFGDAEHRDRIAAELAHGIGAGISAETLRRDRQAVAEAEARVRELAAAVAAALETEQRAAELPRWQPLLPTLVSDVPGAFADGTDLDEAAQLVDQITGDVAGAGDVGTLENTAGADLEDASGLSGWWRGRRQRWQRRSAGRRLHSLLRAGQAVPPDRLRAAISAARAAQATARLAAGGGTDLDATWQALHAAETDLAAAVGVAIRHRANSAARWDRAARRSAAALAGALRAGRNRRRQLLAGMDGEALVRGMPLWVGTASDAEDLLPPVPGLFDLVILDEASHLDQLRAAPVLARAKRAAVVGDPRQLRFVSFVADVDVAATLRRYDLDDRVDVRRISAFDLATGAAAVTWLDRHYRSAPHLIEFSARRFYGGRLSVATRHPANDSLDVIEVVRVGDGSVSDGVNRPEMEAAVRVVRGLAGAGSVSIGVITPFRAQADALESALVEAFSLEELETLALRVGTVHAFQGSEASTVVVSLGLADDDSPSRVRFVADPQLFNVMVTRARDRMVVVTSLTRPDGVVGEYLAFAEAGPSVVPDQRGRSGDALGRRPAQDGSEAWISALATELRRTGATVRRDYPVGGWTVDLVVGEGAAAVGICCRVHPEGISAHLARQRSLVRTGWRMVDAFASRWSGDPGAAAIALTTGSHSTFLHHLPDSQPEQLA
jgi:hypothetical protein